jgi:hypothetical protein
MAVDGIKPVQPGQIKVLMSGNYMEPTADGKCRMWLTNHETRETSAYTVIDRGAKIEVAQEPPYLSDELVEQIAVLHNGGTWPDDYKEEHRQHWRGQAVKIIALVKQYIDNPMYVVTTPETDPEILRAISQLAERGI